METFYEVMRRQGISRRSFLKYGSLTATSLGLDPAFVPQIAHAIHWVRKGTLPGCEMHWQAGAPCSVTGSAGQLQQVLMNLLQNACDAAAGSTAGHPQLWLTTERNDTQVRVLLRDNGPGIVEQHGGRLRRCERIQHARSSRPNAPTRRCKCAP